MAYEAFVFDFFGVVCSEVAPFWFRRYLPEGEAVEVKSRLVGAADRGEISQEELFVRLGEITGIPAAQVEEEWWAYVSINKEVVELIEALKSRYRVALLTNAISGFFRNILVGNRLDELFDPIVISSDEHAAKPDLIIYNRILERLPVPASKVLMIDDNPVNIAGAKEAGMDGVVFESAAQIRAILVRGGYLRGAQGSRS